MCTLRSIHRKYAVGWCIVISKDMGTIKIIDGNIFNSKAQTIVNTVNCVGVMGKGIALVFKLRYPKLFEKYQELCRQRLIEVGKLWLYREEPDAPWVLSFPTKKTDSARSFQRVCSRSSPYAVLLYTDLR